MRNTGFSNYFYIAFKNNRAGANKSLILHSLFIVFLVFLCLYYLYAFTSNSRDQAFVANRNITTYLRRQNANSGMWLHPKCTQAEVVVGVISSPSHQAAREVIREQWKKEHLPKMGFEMIFVVGHPQGEDVQKKIDDEKTKTKDILQLDVEDSYKNLTLKVLSFLSWAKKNCIKSKFVLKVDDDVYINWAKMSTFLTCLDHEISNPYKITKNKCEEYNPQKVMGHYLEQKSERYTSYIAAGYLYNVMKPIRNPQSRWYLDSKLYPHDILPPTLSGTAYLLSSNLLPMIMEASNKELMIDLEDVYITGILLSRNLGLKLSHIEGWSNFRPQFDDKCLFNNLLTIHGLSAVELRETSESVRGLKADECSTLRNILAKINSVFSYYIPRFQYD